MRAICIDDEPLAVEYTLAQCAVLPEIDEAKGFTDAHSALDWLVWSATIFVESSNAQKV